MLLDSIICRENLMAADTILLLVNISAGLLQCRRMPEPQGLLYPPVYLDPGGYLSSCLCRICRFKSMPADTGTTGPHISARRLQCRRIPSCFQCAYPPVYLGSGGYLRSCLCRICRFKSMPADTILLSVRISAALLGSRRIPQLLLMPYLPV